MKAQHNRCPTYLRLWSLTTLCSQQLEMISEGAPAYVNLQPNEPLCFPRRLASALHPWDFKGERKAIFYLLLHFPLRCFSMLSGPEDMKFLRIGCTVNFHKPYPRGNTLVRALVFLAGVAGWNTPIRYIGFCLRHIDTCVHISLWNSYLN